MFHRSHLITAFALLSGLAGLAGLASLPACGGQAGTGVTPDGGDGGDGAGRADRAAGPDGAPADLGSDASPSADLTGDVALPPLTCSGLLPHPVDSVRTLMHEGLARQFRVHVPASYDPGVGVPVVLNFHGFSS